MDILKTDASTREINIPASDGYIQNISIVRSDRNADKLKNHILNVHEIGVFSPLWMAKVKEAFEDENKINWESLRFYFSDASEEVSQLMGKFDYLGLDYTYNRIYKVENSLIAP